MRLAERVTQINEQTLRAQVAQAELDRMMAARRKVAEEVERRYRTELIQTRARKRAERGNW